MKFSTFNWGEPWRLAFDLPMTTGTWFIWGHSGNGKTSFVLQLCKELANYDRVAYLSLEEGLSLTVKEAISRVGFSKIERRNFIILSESFDELLERLDRQRPPRVVVIDSFQYTDLTFKAYREVCKQHPEMLFIFTSHAEGKKPLGRTAKRIKHDAALKIWVEGFRAISQGRFIGSQGYFDIWPKGAQIHWADKINTDTKRNTIHHESKDTTLP